MGNSLSFCESTEMENSEGTNNTEESDAVQEHTEVMAEEAKEEEESPPVKDYGKNPEFWTAPPDARFRSVNQARTCYTRYNEFYKCKLEKDEESEECMFYKRCYETMCPDEWIERWEEMREEGIWAGRY